MNQLNQEKIWERIEKGVFVIAEIGKGFIQTKEDKTQEEYLENAKKLVFSAKEAGAHAVKFQTHWLEDEQMNISITAPHFSGMDRYNWVKRNETATPLWFWQELKKYCDDLGIIFFSTPMSRGAAKILEQVGVEIWKVGSADILDFVMLDYLASTKKPIIISSGMSTLEEIDKAVGFLQKRAIKIALLHCVSQYPCPLENLNLKTIEFFKERYNVPIGFSSHSIEIDSAIAAVQMGARIIEKHFSFSRDFWGSDHKSSLLPDEFKAMVDKIRKCVRVDLADYGKADKVLQEEEAVFRPVFRKSLVAGSDLAAGDILTSEKIYAMRPQVYIDGLHSEEYENVLGKKVIKDLKKYDPIKLEYLR